MGILIDCRLYWKEMPLKCKLDVKTFYYMYDYSEIICNFAPR